MGYCSRNHNKNIQMSHLQDPIFQLNDQIIHTQDPNKEPIRFSSIIGNYLSLSTYNNFDNQTALYFHKHTKNVLNIMLISTDSWNVKTLKKSNPRSIGVLALI